MTVARRAKFYAAKLNSARRTDIDAGLAVFAFLSKNRAFILHDDGGNRADFFASTAAVTICA